MLLCTWFSRCLSEWNTVLQKTWRRTLVSSMSSLAKEQRAGSQVRAFLSHRLCNSPSTGCCELLVGETLQAASSILTFSELQWALERTLSKQNLMRQRVPSPGYSYLNFVRSGWGLLFSICLMRKRRLSPREISIRWHLRKVAESGPPSHIGSFKSFVFSTKTKL